jgi:hypothetical protein
MTAAVVGWFVIILPLKRVWHSRGEGQPQDRGQIAVENGQSDEAIQDSLLELTSSQSPWWRISKVIFAILTSFSGQCMRVTRSGFVGYVCVCSSCCSDWRLRHWIIPIHFVFFNSLYHIARINIRAQTNLLKSFIWDVRQHLECKTPQCWSFEWIFGRVPESWCEESSDLRTRLA